SLLASATSLLLTPAAHAALQASFEMESCVSGSRLIVHGYLDREGNFDSREVLKGTQTAQHFAIVNGFWIYEKLLAAMTDGPTVSSNAIEVVAFLDSQTKDGWRPVGDYAGVA